MSILALNYTSLLNLPTSRLLGRTTDGTGAAEAISAGTGLSLSAGSLAVSLAAFSTSNLSEGSNLYYTDERVDDRVASLLQNGTGLSWSYSDGGNTLTGNVSLAGFSTSNLSEGSNLYYTDERVDDRAAALLLSVGGITWSYNDASGTLSPAVDHNATSNLTVGDVHTQYALLAGRATPQQFAFGTASGAATGYLTSTANATKGSYALNAAGTIVVDELNARLGIGTASPSKLLTVKPIVAGDGIELQESDSTTTALRLEAYSSGSTIRGYTNGSESFHVDTTSNGTFYFTNGPAGFGQSGPVAQVDIGIRLASRVGLIVSGFTSQAANLQEWRDVGNIALLHITPAGAIGGTDGSGSNIVGGNLKLLPGVSTGNATPASVILQSTVAGSSGIAAQTLSDTLTVTNGQVIAAGRVRAEGTDGTKTAPTISLHSVSGATGFYVPATDQLGFAVNNQLLAALSTTAMAFRSAGKIAWSSGEPDAAGNDTGLARNAAGVVEINSGVIGTYRDLKLRAIELVDGNAVLSTTTGTKIGTATGQKLGFWNATPVVQQVLATGAGATVDNVISLLQTLGLCKQS